MGLIKAFEKAGFTEEGTLKQPYFCEGKFGEKIYLGVINQESERKG